MAAQRNRDNKAPLHPYCKTKGPAKATSILAGRVCSSAACSWASGRLL